MDDPDQANTKKWVEAWRRAGPKLEALRRQALRSFRYEDHVEEIDELLQLACRFAQPRPTSGLVEQQRIFQKARTPGDEAAG